MPNASIAPGLCQRPQLNWSHFKPIYAGRPEEDAEARLFRMNDWMDTHDFQDQVKIQRFCLTLVGEARLWYESLRPINADWEGVQSNNISQIKQTPQTITSVCLLQYKHNWQ